MTNEELAKAVSNLTARMNRIEAKVAHDKPTAPTESPHATIENAIELLDRAIEIHGQTSDSYRAMMMDIRRWHARKLNNAS